MVQFQILTGKKAGSTWVARRFPVRIGRGAGANLRLDDEGLWEEHLVVNVRTDGGVEAVVPEPAVALRNGESFRQGVLQNGDVIGMGGLEVRFGLSPTRQRSLRLREALTWIALGILSLGQVALIYWLG